MGGAMCGVGLVAFLTLVLVGAMILRAAVAIANRLTGPPKPDRTESEDRFEDWDWDGELEDERRRRKPEKAIPEPGLGKGMMIASTAGVLTVLFGVLLATALDMLIDDPFDRDETGQVAALAVFTLPFSYIGTALVLTGMLPTTFSRAALVAFLYHALGLGVLAAVAGTIVLVLL